MDIEKLKEVFGEKVAQWAKSQENQTSAYNFEASLVELMREVGGDVLVSQLGKPASSRKKKS